MKYFGYGNGLVDNSTGIEIVCFNNIHTVCVCEGKNLSTCDCDHVTESAGQLYLYLQA
jgi:hypothetical protein